MSSSAHTDPSTYLPENVNQDTGQLKAGHERGVKPDHGSDEDDTGASDSDDTDDSDLDGNDGLGKMVEADEPGSSAPISSWGSSPPREPPLPPDSSALQPNPPRGELPTKEAVLKRRSHRSTSQSPEADQSSHAARGMSSPKSSQDVRADSSGSAVSIGRRNGSDSPDTKNAPSKGLATTPAGNGTVIDVYTACKPLSTQGGGQMTPLDPPSSPPQETHPKSSGSTDSNSDLEMSEPQPLTNPMMESSPGHAHRQRSGLDVMPLNTARGKARVQVEVTPYRSRQDANPHRVRNKVPSQQGDVNRSPAKTLTSPRQSPAQQLVPSTYHQPQSADIHPALGTLATKGSKRPGEEVPREYDNKKRPKHEIKYGFSQEEPVARDLQRTVRAAERDFFNDRQKQNQHDVTATPKSPLRQPAILAHDTTTQKLEKITVPNHSPQQFASSASQASRKVQDRNPKSAALNGAKPRVAAGSDSLCASSGTPLPQPNQPSGQAAPGPATTSPKAKTLLQNQLASVGDTSSTPFATFKAAYPNYKGDIKHFQGQCRKIEQLRKDGKAPHRSLWDDYLIRHHQDYREYSIGCIDEAREPMVYETFYNEEIDEPKYTKRVLTPAMLTAIVLETKRPSPLSENLGNSVAASSSPAPTAHVARHRNRTMKPPTAPRSMVNRQMLASQSSAEVRRLYKWSRGPSTDSYRPDYSRPQSSERDALRITGKRGPSDRNLDSLTPNRHDAVVSACFETSYRPE
ncbi:hypothetical protein LTS18_002178 [Coniosporium uncinatum]|uniref:Uncharacterized protein n=1 Tax=Coniosporium uncinatum TaxID=93489 RepID=A0ACC3DUH1_9PEZI|nr:hypothetical protein LTS18_002178 [Coniosporium uncinatum]